MARVSFGCVAVSLCILALFPVPLLAGQQEDALETGRLLALLLDAGRVTVAKHQDLINAPVQDGSAFSPELFERELRAEFQKSAGIDIGKINDAGIPAIAKPLLTQLFNDSIKTIHTFQPVLSLPGMKYKGLIPATFGTETANRFQNYSKIYLKQTAPSRFVRNPKNRPDDYEEQVFERLAAQPPSAGPARIVSELSDGGRSMRVILPLYYGQSCLACHGEPKGERDISGFAREGARLNDLGGAISVKIPLQ